MMICFLFQLIWESLRWRHNGRDSVLNHQPPDCLLNRLFRSKSKKTSKLRVTGLCAGNSTGTGEFPAQIASNAENVSIWWRHHVIVWHIWLIFIVEAIDNCAMVQNSRSANQNLYYLIMRLFLISIINSLGRHFISPGRLCNLSGWLSIALGRQWHPHEMRYRLDETRMRPDEISHPNKKSTEAYGHPNQIKRSM